METTKEAKMNNRINNIYDHINARHDVIREMIEKDGLEYNQKHVDNYESTYSLINVVLPLHQLKYKDKPSNNNYKNVLKDQIKINKLLIEKSTDQQENNLEQIKQIMHKYTKQEIREYANTTKNKKKANAMLKYIKYAK